MLPSITSRLRTTSEALPAPFRLSRKRSLPALSSLPYSAYFFAPTSTPPSERNDKDDMQGGELIVFPSAGTGSSKQGAEGGRWFEGGGAASTSGSRGGRPKAVGLSRPKVEMAKRLLTEALEQDGNGDENEDGGEYVVHLLALSISTIRSSVPPTYLDSHPPAKLALEGPPASEAETANAGNWKEDVVNGVVGGLGWLTTSGVTATVFQFLVFLTQAVIVLASHLRLGEMFFLLLAAVAASPHLQDLHGFLLDLIWIVFECFRRGMLVLGGAGPRRDRRDA